MKNQLSSTTFALLFILLIGGCTKDLVEPEFYGNIEGTVLYSSNNSGISGVSIETSPATEVILTNGDGFFQLKNIPAGTYQIKTFKPKFKSKSVSIEVRENKTATAKILLESEDKATAENLEARVTSWIETGPADSTTVEIEYQVGNNSSNSTIGVFEVYFDIDTNQQTLYYELRDSTLAPGEQNIGSFKKFIHDSEVSSVSVSGVWVRE